MDQNWFFSAIAQSAAAIVGIFSAFIFTKIINNQQEFAKNKVKIKELFSHSQKLIDDLSIRYFDWFNKNRLKEALDDLEADVREERKILPPEECISKYNFPIFLTREELMNSITEKLEMLKEELRIEEEKRLEEAKKASFRHPLFSIPTSIPLLHNIRIPNMPNVRLYDQLLQEEELIKQLINEVRLQTRVIDIFKKEISKNPQSSALITFSIILAIFLYYIGVVCPLNLLSASVVIKTGLLSAISLIYTSILAVFLVINLKMKYKKEDLEKLDFYSQFKNYSEYLKIMEENIS